MKDPPRMGEGRKKSGRREKGENCSSPHDLENPYNLVLKEEEEEEY